MDLRKPILDVKKKNEKSKKFKGSSIKRQAP